MPGDMPDRSKVGRPSMPQGLILGFYLPSEDVVVVLLLMVTF